MKKKVVFLLAALLSLAVGAADPVVPKRTAPEAQGDVTGKMFEALGIPKNQVREAWNTPELKSCAARWHEVTLRYENGHVGIYEVWDRELAALRALMSQPEVAASPLMLGLHRTYLKRLRQQFDMLKWEYEAGHIGLEPVRKKESEIAEYRKKWGLPENERDMELVASAEKHLVAVCGEKVPDRQQRRFRTSAGEDAVTIELRTESGGKGEVTLRRSDAAILKCVYRKSGGESAKKLGPNPVEPVPEIAEKLRAGLTRANPGWECTEESFSLFRTELGLNLRISGEGIADLSALEEFDFDTVWLIGTAVRGTGFLKNAKSLRAFAVINDKNGSREVDLSGLRGKPLRNLGLANVRVADPACLAEIEFRILNLDRVENVDPAKFSRLRELESFSAKDMTIADVGFLRSCPKLRSVCLENVTGGAVTPR